VNETKIYAITYKIGYWAKLYVKAYRNVFHCCKNPMAFWFFGLIFC